MILREPARHGRLLLLTVAVLALAGSSSAGQVQHVFHISVDGLRPDAITTLGPTELPNFYRLQTEGAFTLNARCDYFDTDTLPNHVTELTGRGVKDPYGNRGAAYSGHDWLDNNEPVPTKTLQTNKGAYVAGVFDVAHSSGLTTGLYATKSKFVLFTQSWPGLIDHSFILNNDSRTLLTRMEDDVAAQAQNYTFLHLNDPDVAGHAYGWMSEDYLSSVRTVDGYLGEVFQLIAENPSLAGQTAIVLTADHGGTGTGHEDAANPYNYTIPFYVWGPGVLAGADLYSLNVGSRLDPGTARPTYYDSGQPIVNGEAGNLSLHLLGLDPIPGSWLSFPRYDITPSPGDANADRVANGVDLGILSANFGQSGKTCLEGDFNGDGVVDGVDLGILSANFLLTLGGGEAAIGGEDGEPAPVPEPGFAAFLLGGALGLLRARRRRESGLQ